MRERRAPSGARGHGLATWGGRVQERLSCRLRGPEPRLGPRPSCVTSSHAQIRPSPQHTSDLGAADRLLSLRPSSLFYSGPRLSSWRVPLPSKGQAGRARCSRTSRLRCSGCVWSAASMSSGRRRTRRACSLPILVASRECRTGWAPLLRGGARTLGRCRSCRRGPYRIVSIRVTL